MKPVLVALGAVAVAVLGIAVAFQLFGTPIVGSGRQPAAAPGATAALAVPTAGPVAGVSPGPADNGPAADPATDDPGVSSSWEPAPEDSSSPDGLATGQEPGTPPPDGDTADDGATPAPVTAAIQSLRKRTANPDWGPLDTSTFDPAAELSAVTVTAGATGVGQVQVLLFHRSTYLGRGTSRPVVSALVDTDDGAPEATVGVDYQWDPQVPYSSGVFGHEQFVAFHWNGTKVVMEGNLPDAAFD